MKRPLQQLRNWAAGLLLGLLSALPATAASSTGVSPVFTVDLQVRSVAVSGRVLDAVNRAAVSGATVTLAGQSTSSSGAGQFSFASLSLSSGNTLVVSKSGYAPATKTIGGANPIVQDVELKPSSGSGKPEVTSIRPALHGIFIETVPILNEYTASVDWHAATPEKVEFYVNGTLVQTVPTSSTEATATLVNMGHLFFGSYRLGANSVSAVAVGSSGRSDPFDLPVAVIPKPTFFPPLDYIRVLSYDNPKIALEFVVPPPGDLKAESDLPIPGMPMKYGLELSARARLEYAIITGEWDLKFGGGPRFVLGPASRFEIGLGGHATGVATFDKGIVFEPLNGRFYFYLDQRIYEALVSQLVPGGEAFRLLDTLKYVGIDPNSIQRINVYVLVRLDADFGVDLSRWPGNPFNPQELQIKVGPRIAFEPDLKIAKLSIYAGGYVGGTFDLDPFGLKKISAQMYVGYKLISWGLVVSQFEGVWFNYDVNFSPASGIALASAVVMDDGWVLLPAERKDIVTTVDRSYLCAGPERFIGGATGAGLLAGRAMGASGLPVGVSPLEAFRDMGCPVASAATRRTKDPQPKDGPQFDQADLPLLENVFPGSAPALAGRGQDLMLLYVTDNGSPNDLQFTDIRWTRFDGTNWSDPTTIQTNTQAEFSPQVAYDGNGDALAIWERVADPNFNQTNLPAMAAQMEIVWSKWNHTSGAWSTPVPLTSNGYLDHAPLLCGPMAGGSVLASWTANTSNLLMGTNGAGSQVLWAQWNPGSQSWSSPQTLLADLPYRLSQSLSGVSNLAVYAWSRDMDGVLTNASDQQVFYAEWSGSAWGAPMQMTTNAVGNRNARVVVSPNAAGASVEGFESGNFSSQPWSFTGNVPWAVQSGTVRSGSQAAASGTIAHSQTSGMSLALNCQAGTISFAYSVSSESGYDYLRFYLDGVQRGQWSGTVGWTTVSYPVTAGPHTFEWRYTKDGIVSSGSDKAWVDDINLPLPSGQKFYVAWQQGTNLVLSADKGITSSLVRADSQTAGFADYAMTIGPAGNLALLWQEMSQAGSDAHYRVLDPASATWSKDAQLFNDPPLERSFAPVWDAVGNLTVAYNKVEMLYTNKTVTLEGGGSVTITNVPQPGRVDLCVTKRRLSRMCHWRRAISR